jgi:uncharacterized lipoprotein YmbA
MKRLLAVLVLPVVLAACVTRHSSARLYVLEAAVAREAAAAAEVPGAVLGVSKVSVPAWIDRPEITSRTAKGHVVPDDESRWGEPLSRGIQRVMAENLAALLPDRHVVTAPFAARQAVDHRLEVNVTEAARQADGMVLVEARWVVFDSSGKLLVSRRSSHRTGPATAPGGAVTATSEALGLLSRDIAEAVRALPPPTTTP